MNMNQTALLNYNKYSDKCQGTLIYNWWEERELRDGTGVSRTLNQQHLQKTRKELFLSPPHEIESLKQVKPKDNTNERTLGAKTMEIPNSENYNYGKGINRADTLRKVGQKSLQQDSIYKQIIEKELKEKDQQEINEQNARCFDTTTKSEFYQKNASEAGNTVGKRVMRTQDGKPVSSDQRDNDLLNELGFLERQPFLTDLQLKELLPKGESYLTQQPITFWTEKQNQGCYYMSKPTIDDNQKTAFSKNNEFLKTYTHYSHVKK